MVSFRGQKILGHTMIGLLWGINSKFLTSISTLSFAISSPLSPPPALTPPSRKHLTSLARDAKIINGSDGAFSMAGFYYTT